ncbi:MAG: hypothetical protein DRQ14_00745 [Candidatus Latescibacterota bacterium]|nr:MAG: hypothetical protein DRQ14_00745 [Candidatus Latescibacterota bacterium]
MGEVRTEIVLNSAIHETRIAILEDGRLVELLVERPEQERMVGNIYKGVVQNVLPGMQAAFVDIGTGKNAFLHASDVWDLDFLDLEEERHGRPGHAPIQQKLRKGQEILVQVTKEPIGDKGPKVTTAISLPGRFVVLAPGQEELLGVSRKITDPAERRRLRKLASSLRPEHCGVIVRTVAKGKGEKEIGGEIKKLAKLWEKVLKASQKVRAPALLHREMGITSSLVRDLFSEDVDRVVVDSKKEYKRILSYLKEVSPHLRERVELYDGELPIFDAFHIEEQVEEALGRRVELKTGGFLVIDHTEALVAIDVNTGRYVGRYDQEDTILKINLEAAREIARQLRLRDIGGIIVIDFIDMASPRNRRRVEQELAEALKRDRARTNILPINQFGLLEMTRQRMRPSLLYTFSEPCPVCGGVGRVQGRDTTVTKIERCLKRARVYSGERKFVLRVHPSVAEYLSEDRNRRLKLLQKSAKVKVELEEDRELSIEDFRVISERTGEDVTERYGRG